MRALITGVTGQDGWYLSRELVADGVEVFGVVTADEPVPHGVHGIAGDVRDLDSLRRAVRESQPDEVYHLASVSSVAQSWADPARIAEINGMGTVRLLQAVSEYRAAGGTDPRLVHASSAEIFGDAAPPQDETTPVRPITPYGAAKAFAHQSTAIARGEGLFAANAVLFNHESPHRPSTFVTRKITKAVAEIARGDRATVQLGNLDARRDWGYAGDYVQAMIAIARADHAADYVVATGRSHSVADFVRLAFERVGIVDWRRHVVVNEGSSRPRDAAEQRGNPALIRQRLGWTPDTTLDQLVAIMVDADLAVAE